MTVGLLLGNSKPKLHFGKKKKVSFLILIFIYFPLLARSYSIVIISKSWKLHDTVFSWEISERFLQTQKARGVLIKH